MVLEIIANLPYGNYILALIMIVVSIVAAHITIYIIGHIVLHVTSKTKTTLDDVILDAIKKPLYFSIIIAGIYVAVDSLNFADTYLIFIMQGIKIIWILLGAFISTKIFKVVFQWYASKSAKNTHTQLDNNLLPIMRKIINIFIYSIAFLIILHSFGIEITPLLAGLGIGGLAIALALQDSLSNLFSGTFMVTDKMIKIGDFIEIDANTKGYVEEIGWRSTRIRTLANNMVIIPNSKLANNMITDYSEPVPDIPVLVECGVAYDSDLEKVEKITLDVANEVIQRVDGGKKDFQPSVRFHTFSDSNINFTVGLRAMKFEDQYILKHEFIKALKKRFDKEGIEISYPVRKIVDSRK